MENDIYKKMYYRLFTAICDALCEEDCEKKNRILKFAQSETEEMFMSHNDSAEIIEVDFTKGY